MSVFQIKGTLMSPRGDFNLYSDEEVAKAIGRVRASNPKIALKQLERKIRNLANSGYGVSCDYLERVKFLRIPEKERSKKERRDKIRTRAVVIESWVIKKRISFSLLHLERIK
ncbi:MAG: hypothetical protein AAB432_02170 [Patescibacteria group bacterium]